MKKLLVALAILASAITSSWAKTNITIVYPYSTTHSTAPLFFTLVEEMNKVQNRYNFVFEIKPGADGLIAVNHMNQDPGTRVAVIAAAFVDNVDNNKILESDYVHMVGLGNMCLAVFSKTGNEKQGVLSMSRRETITVGTVGWANAAHLTALNIGEKLGVPVRNIVFRSNRDALINLLQDGGVTFVLDRIDALKGLEDKGVIKPNIVGVTCNQRIASAAHIPTMSEQGITAPAPWIIVTSNKAMPTDLRTSVTNIMHRALQQIGAQKVWELSSLEPLIFHNFSVNDFYNQKANAQRELTKKYQNLIDDDRGKTSK